MASKAGWMVSNGTIIVCSNHKSHPDDHSPYFFVTAR